MRTSNVLVLMLFVLVTGDLQVAAIAEESAKPIEPQLASTTLEDCQSVLQPIQVVTPSRFAERVGQRTVIIEKNRVGGIDDGKTKPTWTVEAEKEHYLHVAAHGGERVYFTSYNLDEQGNYSPVIPQRVRILEVKQGKWLGYLSEEKTGTIAAVLADQEHVAVLRLNGEEDFPSLKLKSYDVTYFAKDHAKPLWSKTFSATAQRGEPGVYLLSASKPNYANSTIQHLAWLGDRLLVCAEAVQPILCLSRESGTTVWQLERPWEFERGFTGPSVWRHHIGRMGREMTFDGGDHTPEKERAEFDARFQCAIVGGPIVVPRRAADHGDSHSIFLAISKGPADHLGGYVSDCMLYEFDSHAKPVAMLKLPQMVQGGDFALHGDGVIWRCQNEALLKIAITKSGTDFGIGPGGRDYLARMPWFQQSTPPEVAAWLCAGKSRDPVAFGRKFAYFQPMGGYIAAKEKSVYDFPLVALELESGQQHSLLLHVPFRGKFLESETDSSESEKGGARTIRTFGPHVLAITRLRADGDRLEITLGMENWSSTLIYDLGKLASATANAASTDKEEDRIKQWLAAIGDVNARDENGNTPLLHAAHDYDGPQLRALLKAGADPKAVSKFGWTALMSAACYGSADAVQALIDAGSDVNAQDNNCGGQSVLMWAARSDKQSSVKVRTLLKAGANAKLTSEGGYNALFSAVSNNDLVSVELLLRAGLDPKHRTIDGKTAIMVARERHADENLISLLRQAGAEEK